MTQMRAFSVLQKWTKMTYMTPNDLLTLEMVLTELPRNTKQNTLLVPKISYFCRLRAETNFTVI